MAKTVFLMVGVLLISCFAVLPLSAKAESMVLTVPDDYSTIQIAVDFAKDGDTVFVRAGNYSGTVEIGKSITLIGEDNKAIINDWSITGQAAILITGNNVTVSGMTIDNPTYTTMWTKKRGIHLLDSSNCTITNNVIRNCDSGRAQAIWLYQAQDNYIADNIMEKGNIGINLGDSTRNTITNNTIRNMNEEAIFLEQSNQNTITANTLVDDTAGLQLKNSNYNTFFANNISCTQGVRFAVVYNVYTTEANGNLFFHNNFFEGTQYPYVHLGTEVIGATYYETDYTVIGTNFFDNRVEGNYYARHKGTDLNRDGIDDKRYGLSIAGSFFDNYPLMSPWLGDKRAPITKVVFPEQEVTLTTREVMLNFTVNEETSQLKYSLDGTGNVTILGNVSISLSGLSNGDHNICVYATDLAGNEAAPQLVHFRLDVPLFEGFSLVWIVLAVALVVVVVALLVRRRFPNKTP